jgi:hypothetical protein
MKRIFLFGVLPRIFFLFLFASVGFASDKEVFAACKESIVPLVPHIPGWCSQKKAEAMMDLIFEVKPTVCVELGVFAGASILPTASALKCLGRGIVYAIDPWDNYECTKFFPETSPHKQWWNDIDLNYMYHYFLELIKSHQLSKCCFVLKSTSENAVFAVDKIDILHIDSTHCDESALLDVTLYVPKVKLGGYIWFDGWNSTPNAFEYVKKSCYVKKVIDQGRCILLEKVSP